MDKYTVLGDLTRRVNREADRILSYCACEVRVAMSTCDQGPLNVFHMQHPLDVNMVAAVRGNPVP